MTERANTRLAALDFRRDIERLTEDFTGREWLFEEIDNWLHNTDQRFLILTGEPGAGKSAIAARLTQVRSDNITAYHFCIAGSVGTITPNTALRSLAAQLGEFLPGYGEALANTIKPHQVSVNIKQEIGQVKAGAKVVGVVINHLIASDPEEELDILFRAPLTEVAVPKTPVFILIDSLDEAMTYQGKSNLITLLAKTNDLPPWVRFVCTTRPEDALLSHFKRFEPYTLAAESQMNLGDVDRYINYRVGQDKMQTQLQAANVASEDLTRQVAELAGGNFLYTKVLLNDIEAGQQPLDDLTALPRSLDDIYHSFLRRFSDKDWDEKYQPILGKLTVVQEPITEKQLANFTGHSQRQVRRSLAVIGQYMDIVEDGEGSKTYRLFHQSLRDYLLDEERSDLFWCNSQEEHKHVAESYLAGYQTDWSACDLYGLCHLPLHLAKAEQTGTLLRLLFQFEWLYVKLEATDVVALIADYDYLLGYEDVRRVKDALRLSAHALVPDKTQLAGQLLGRLLDDTTSSIQALLEEAKQFHEVPWLRPLRASLTPPGGSLLRTIVDHHGVFALTPDGKQVISASGEILRIWDLKSGETTLMLRGHRAPVTTVALTPDGHRLVSGSLAAALIVWDLRTGKALNTLTGGNYPVETVAITPNGRHVIFARSRDDVVNVWDLTSSTEVKTLKDHSGNVIAVAAMPGNRRVVSVSYSTSGFCELIVWDLDTASVVTKHQIDPVTEAVVTPNGQRVVTNKWGEFQVWDVETGSEWKKLLDDTPRSSLGGALGIAPNSLEAVLASPSGRLEVWDLERGARLKTLSDAARSVKQVTVTPDGHQVITRDSDGMLQIWDMQAEEDRTHDSPVTAVTVDNRGDRAVSGHRDGTLTIWNLQTATEPKKLQVSNASILAIELIPESQYAVVSCGDRKVTVWNLQTGRELKRLKVKDGPVKDIALMLNGHRVIVACHDGHLRVWDLQTNVVEEEFFKGYHIYPVDVVGISSDGQVAVSMSREGRVKIWDLRTGEEKREPEDPLFVIYPDFLSREKRQLVDKHWTETPAERLLLSALAGRQLPLPESEGYKVILPSLRREIRIDRQVLELFDQERQEIIAVFSPDKNLLCCAATPDEQVFVAGESSGNIHILHLEGTSQKLRE